MSSNWNNINKHDGLIVSVIAAIFFLLYIIGTNMAAH